LASTGVNVGSYGITASGAVDGNYTISYAPGTLKITPASLTITADDATRVYGAANPAFSASYDGLVNGNTPSVVSGLTFTSAPSSANVGAYQIVPSGASASNYAISYAPGTLTVTPAALTITANDATRTYGAANPAFTASYGGLVNGDTSSVVSGLSFSSAPSSVDAGTYQIVPSGAAASNYAISYAPGTLTVTQATLTISANNKTLNYGAVNPQFSVTYSGLVNGDTSAVVTGLDIETDALIDAPNGVPTLGAHPGFYNIFVSGGSSKNYSITYVTGQLAVAEAPLVITPSGTRVYGQPLAADGATFSAVGFVNGDSLASLARQPGFITAALTGSNAGNYLITAAGAVDRDYVITYQPGTYVVTPAPVTLTPNPAEITTGNAIPTIGITATGLLGSDTVSTLFAAPPAVTTTANTSSPPGTYTTTIVGTVTDGNYTVTFNTGALTIDANNLFGPVVFLDPGTTIVNTTTTPITSLPPVTPATLSLTPPDPPITVNPLYTAPFVYGKALGSFGPEAGNVIDQFIASATNSNPPVTRDQVIAALKNPDTSTATLGVLLPFLYADLDNILKLPQSSWTEAQADFVSQMQNYVQAQRQAAALQGEADYETWAKAAVTKEETQINAVTGPAQVTEMAILSGSPPVPPPDFLNEVQSGLVLTNNQAATVAGLTAQVSAFGDAITATQGVATAGELASTGFTLSANGASTLNLVNNNPALGKIFKSAKRSIADLASDLKVAQNKLSIAQTSGVGVEKATTDVEKAEEAVKLTTTVGDVVATAGVVLEVVGNAVQIALGAASYAQAADYNKAFQNAVSAANQPVSVADLKNMMANPGGQQQMFGYLESSLATGTPDSINNPLPGAKPDQSLSSIVSITSTF
jgi:hypothetical protein